MSRLIDADAPCAEVKHWKRQQHSMNIDYSTGYRCALSVVEGMIADAPTVDAIPVEWLRGLMLSTEDDVDKVELAWIMREWESEKKEQEAKACD